MIPKYRCDGQGVAKSCVGLVPEGRRVLAEEMPSAANPMPIQGVITSPYSLANTVTGTFPVVVVMYINGVVAFWSPFSVRGGSVVYRPPHTNKASPPMAEGNRVSASDQSAASLQKATASFLAILSASGKSSNTGMAVA